MLDENRVRLMIKLALYEESGGEKELKARSFFKKDYVRFNVWISLLWVSVGFAALGVIIFWTLPESFIDSVDSWVMVLLLIIYIAVYAAALVGYGMWQARVLREAYSASKDRVKEYKADLDALGVLYEGEGSS